VLKVSGVVFCCVAVAKESDGVTRCRGNVLLPRNFSGVLPEDMAYSGQCVCIILAFHVEGLNTEVGGGAKFEVGSHPLPSSTL